jgi:hypothetical protein
MIEALMSDGVKREACAPSATHMLGQASSMTALLPIPIDRNRNERAERKANERTTANIRRGKAKADPKS